MAEDTLYSRMQEARRRGDKQLAVLIDPDKVRPGQEAALAAAAGRAGVDYLFVGGSLLVNPGAFDVCLRRIREHCELPIVLFPGSPFQISERADAILFLSLISGRNAELLIGQHVLAAPHLRDSSLEVLPTGYVLVDGGAPTTVSYMSNTTPVPADKPDIAACTALAGQLLGLRLIYLDAGSGAHRPVSPAMIGAVRQVVEVPLLVGGGIRSPERARASAEAGADLIVVGNALETDPSLLGEMAGAVHAARKVN